ncbi:uncharacterized protein METZ01_LOCUS503259, partial [marine metagenome]
MPKFNAVKTVRETKRPGHNGSSVNTGDSASPEAAYQAMTVSNASTM